MSETTCSEPLELSGRTEISFDIYMEAGASQNVVKTGTSWSWCESPSWGWANAGTSWQTVTFDRTRYTCVDMDLSKVQALDIFIGDSPVYVDNIRVR